MPTLEDYIAESDQYDKEDLAAIPEDLQSQVNNQLDIAASASEETEST